MGDIRSQPGVTGAPVRRHVVLPQGSEEPEVKRQKVSSSCQRSPARRREVSVPGVRAAQPGDCRSQFQESDGLVSGEPLP